MSEQRVYRRERPDLGVIEEYIPGENGQPDTTVTFYPADTISG